MNEIETVDGPISTSSPLSKKGRRICIKGQTNSVFIVRVDLQKKKSGLSEKKIHTLIN